MIELVTRRHTTTVCLKHQAGADSGTFQHHSMKQEFRCLLPGSANVSPRNYR